MTTAKIGQDNRRQSRRRPARQSIRVQCRKGAFGFGDNVAESFLDVSEGGIRLVARTALEVGQQVEVCLEGNAMGRGIKRVAKVVWALVLESGNHCVGLQFEKRIAYADLQKLARL
jgi:c-di-GMP-binding flagellar brake protein YcgR